MANECKEIPRSQLPHLLGQRTDGTERHAGRWAPVPGTREAHTGGRRISRARAQRRRRAAEERAGRS